MTAAKAAQFKLEIQPDGTRFREQGNVMSGYTENDKKQDIHILHSKGYAQELERRMSSFSNFAISFSIICILSGGINSLGQATAGAGCASIGIGWPLGCLIQGSLR